MPLPEPLSNPLPVEPLERIKRLTRDLAWGALNGLWPPEFVILTYRDTDLSFIENSSSVFKEYLETIWTDSVPEIRLLPAFGYLRDANNQSLLTEKAFNLLGVNRPESIFISYRRSVSSSFAMLIAAELRNEGFKPFIDIQDIPLGDKWHALVEQKVRESNIFIIVIGPTSLESPYVQAEIEWALENPEHRRIIPTLHSGFTAENLATSKYYILGENNLIPIATDTAPNFYAALELLKNQLGV